MSSGRLSWGHLTVWIHTRFKHAVNIQKVLVWGSLKQCQFYCWPLTPSATVGKQAVNTRSVSTLKGHAPIFPLACVCDFLKHCCVNKPKWDRKDGVCPGHVDVWRLCVKKGHWHKRGLLLWGVKRKNQHKVNIKKKLMTMKRRKKDPSQERSNVPHQQKWMTDATIWRLGKASPVTPSYQLSGQEKVLLPRHHHTNTFSLLSATQHGHKFLLAATSHVYSVHLQRREKMITARRLLHRLCKWRIM